MQYTQLQNIIRLNYIYPSPPGEIKHQTLIKLDQIKICALFERKWNTVSSSVLRIMIVLSNGELRSIFGTEKQKQNITLRVLLVDNRLC